ncbi:MAG: A/G-specific adenine glycosylase [Pirellulales bacterium]|nr:A/G-specific adenine glycosylase [Pirellulales bacterium]
MSAINRAPAKHKPWSAAWLHTVRRKLAAWYRRHARELPWRGTRDPYSIWISEIMLQQTQVATVARFYSRFLAALPTIAALAAAPEDRVLRLWEGLGYYRRARLLHAAAKTIVKLHQGVFPRDSVAVRQLPGIGRYTAGAILSIAFDRREPILEANTVRLLSRLLAYGGDPTKSAGQQLLWQLAEALLPARDCGQFNQALMELGSLICTPREPKCDRCPLESLCPTRRAGLQNMIPMPKRPPAMEDVCEAAVIIDRRGKVLLRKCANGERWAGLWDFPRFRLNAANGVSVPRQVVDNVRCLTGIQVNRPKPFATLRHGVTRFRITLDCYTATWKGAEKISNSQGQQWASAAELEDYPLSTTGRQLAKLWRAKQPDKLVVQHSRQNCEP